MKRYILKIDHLRDAEKDNLKMSVIVDIQRNENIALEMNAVNNETDDTGIPYLKSVIRSMRGDLSRKTT